MIKNLILHSLRALNRQKAYVVINLIGLSIGIACSLVIILFIIHQLSFDKFYENNERIYRIVLSGKIGGQEVEASSTASPVGPTIYNEFPEIEEYVRLNFRDEIIIKHNDEYFIEDAFMEADSTFFSVFSIPLLKGERKTVLNAPHLVVLSASTAKKLFGNADPINNILFIGNDSIPYRISGVMKDIEPTSHFDANMIGSFMTNKRAISDHWTSNSFDTYLMLKKGTSAEQVNARIPDLIKRYVGPEIEKFMNITIDEFLSNGNRYTYYLQPLTNIHLNPKVQHGVKPSSDPKYLFIFGSIAILIILIASINFMNLSTAQASKRAKEVGIKKVSGSPRRLLIGQFLTESIILSIISLIIAVFIIELSLPYFNNLLETSLKLNYFEHWFIIPLLIVMAIFIGLLAGSYPSFYLSSFNPYLVLKGKLSDSIKNGKLRSVLVVLQFSISIILIVGTLIMFRQIQYMLNKDPGFNKEQLMVLKRAETIGDKIEAFKNAVKNIPEVIAIASSTAVPNHENNNNGYGMEGRNSETYLMQTNWVDYDYFTTYGLNVNTGRVFNEQFITDKNACIVNESAIKEFNIINPFETRIITPSDSIGENNYFSIIGVVENFHYQSLHSKINPYLFKFKDASINWGYISIRLSENATKSTITEIEKIWKDFSANSPMQYFFMDKDFELKYKEEKQNAQLSILFTIIAILIASMGLFGLTSFAIQQRTKEIGIRRALGASVSSIFYLITKETVVLVCISTFIAWPLIYFVAKNWLQNYYYRINLGIFDFLTGFAIALFIAIITISYKTLKSASVNPSDSLRYE